MAKAKRPGSKRFRRQASGEGGEVCERAKDMRTLLFDVTPNDPATFTGVAILLFVVALLACFLPARRASEFNPIEALRHD